MGCLLRCRDARLGGTAWSRLSLGLGNATSANNARQWFIIESLKLARKPPTPELAPPLTSLQHRKRHEHLLGYLPSGQVTLKVFIPFYPRVPARDSGMCAKLR